MKQESQKSRILSDALVYSGSNYFSQLLGILTSIFLRTFLGPTAMGMWMVVQVILDYSGQAALGTTRAMFREYPRAIGAGKLDLAEAIKNTTLSFALLMSFLPFLAILFYLIFTKSTLDPQFKYCLFFLLGFLFIQRFYDFIITLLRADRRFHALAALIALNAVTGLTVVLIGANFFHLKGLLWGTALNLFFLALIAMRFTGHRFKLRINRKVLYEELKIALPLSGNAFLSTFLRGFDKLLVAKLLGFYEAGIYSLAIMVGNYIMSFPMMFSHVWYPHLQEVYMRRGENQKAILGYFEKPLIVLAVFIPALCAGALALMPLVVYYLLPNFAEGISVMRINMLGFFFVALGLFSNTFLVTVNRFWPPMMITSLTIAVCGGLNWILVMNGWGLPGVALGTMVSFALNGLLGQLTVLDGLLGLKERLLLLARSTMLYLGLMAVILIIDDAVKDANLWLEALKKLSLMGILLMPFLFWIEKQFSILQNVLKKIIKRKARV